MVNGLGIAVTAKDHGLEAEKMGVIPDRKALLESRCGGVLCGVPARKHEATRFKASGLIEPALATAIALVRNTEDTSEPSH